MTYLQDKKQNNIKKKFLVFGILSVLVYVLLFTRVFNTISNKINFIAVPVWKIQKNISDMWNDVSTGFTAKKNLEYENELLKEDIRSFGVKILERNLLYKENIELRKILGRDTSSSGKFVLAAVLVKPNKSLYDTVIIDIGKNAGVKKGDKVLYEEGVVVGKIVEVFKNSSKVLLLSSPKEKVDVVVGGGDISAVAYGRGGGNFEIKLPRDVNVEIGDTVSIPGMNVQILGFVEYIESRPSDPFKTIIFKGPVDVFKLNLVKVMVGGSV